MSDSLPFISAVHYFGSQWPKNFWSSFTESEVPTDFAAIRSDGFNTVILVLPMRMFNESSSSFYRRRLKYLITEAKRHGLFIILRVNYPHDLVQLDSNLLPIPASIVATQIHIEKDVYQDFLNHLEYVKSTIEGDSAILFVFLSWEDTWGAFKNFPHLPLEKRLNYSQKIGFDDFVKVRLGNDLRLKFGFKTDKINPIPTREDPKFQVYKDFYDYYTLEKFIKPANRRFSNLAYEQRVDSQIVYNQEGAREWVRFASYPTEDITSFSYWAPFMGQKNEGETIDSEIALNGLKRVEERVRRESGRKHFINQFNFINGTAEFSGATARINPCEVPTFLQKALPYLLETSLGYGLWTYRDYRESYIVNGTFENGLFKWLVSGDVKESGSSPNWLTLIGDCKLATDIFATHPFRKFKSHYGPFQLSFVTEVPEGEREVVSGIDCIVNFCHCTIGFKIDCAKRFHHCEVEIDYSDLKEASYPLEIFFRVPAGCKIKVRDFQFYNFILSNGNYGVDGKSSSEMDVIREFNNSLNNPTRFHSS